MLSVCFCIGLLAFSSDYLLQMVDGVKIGFSNSWIGRILFYWLFSFGLIYVYFLFVIFIAEDLLVRILKLNMLLFILISVCIAGFLGYATKNEAFRFYPGKISSVDQLRHLIIFIIGGFVYPFLSRFWESRFKFIEIKE